jgi:hypothetical protein
MKSYWVEAGDMLMHRHHKDMIEVRLFSEVREEMQSLVEMRVKMVEARLKGEFRKEIELRKRWFKQKLINDLKPIKVKEGDLIPIHLSDIDEAFTKPIAEIEKELKEMKE